MKKYLILALGLCVTALALQRKALNRERMERQRYEGNTEVLLSDVERYKTSDSLNAARVRALELTAKEFRKYRKEDAELIKTLRTKNRELAQYVGVGTETEVRIETEVRDTVVLRDSVPVASRVVMFHDPWVTLHGTMEADIFTGDIRVRDSLVVVEMVQRRRFLGFLWKTQKVKCRTWEVVSKCPYTRIKGAEVVTVRD